MNPRKLFVVNANEQPPGVEPDNTNLCQLLATWGQQQSAQIYKAVIDEILKGNGYLLLPSLNKEKRSTDWETTIEETTLNLTCIFDINGRKVLGAFSDEPSLVKWAKQPTDYTAMATRDLLEFCQLNSIDRVVINSGEENMFVLERGQ